MSARTWTDADVLAALESSRAASGVPTYLVDPVVADQVAVLFGSAGELATSPVAVGGGVACPTARPARRGAVSRMAENEPDGQAVAQRRAS